MDRPRFALRFISGKYQGGEFPLRPNREIVIGRSSDLDMVLVEDMVSRRHSRVITTADQIFIEDAGSTNGTFVNGEKIPGRVQLHEGDRVLVGTSIIKVIALDANSPSNDAPAPQKIEPAISRPTHVAGAGRPMSGVIEEIPLPDLIQLLSTSRKSGALTVASPSAVGRLYFRKGLIYFATIDDDMSVAPQKAVYRMLSWTEGTFELEPNAEIQAPEEMQDSVEGLLMEGMRQMDEIRNMENFLPPPGSPLAVPTPLAGRLRELSPEELDVFQLVLDHGSLQKVLDHYPGSDVDCATRLVALMKREFVVVP